MIKIFQLYTFFTDIIAAMMESDIEGRATNLSHLQDAQENVALTSGIQII